MLQGLRGSLEKHQGIGLALFRVMAGGALCAHGYLKFFGEHGIAGMAQHLEQMGFPLPTISAWLAGLAEFVGGGLIALGLGTRLAAIPAAFTMGVAVFAVHWNAGFFLPDGYEYPLVLMIAYIMFIFTGAGPISLDAMMCCKKQA